MASTEKLRLTLLSPERRLLEGATVDSLLLTGSEGQIEILPGHALETGFFNYKVPGDSSNHGGVISSGFFEVHDNKVVVMAETLELKGEINVERARKAQGLAEQTLKEAALDPDKFNKYQLKLQRSLIRQQVAGK
jgi:F-type H+-transporting ATPase subunit epsilon